MSQYNRWIQVFVLLLFSLKTMAAGTPTFSLTVNVDGLRNANGVVQFALYNKAGTIPDESYTKYYKKKTAPISNGVAQIEFSGLPAGRYAVNILHDENSDGKIEKGFLLPVEGIGFSNFTSIGLSNRPDFEKASFMLTNDKTVQVTVIYM